MHNVKSIVKFCRLNADFICSFLRVVLRLAEKTWLYVFGIVKEKKCKDIVEIAKTSDGHERLCMTPDGKLFWLEKLVNINGESMWLVDQTYLPSDCRRS
jgi:hypothetical protein